MDVKQHVIRKAFTTNKRGDIVPDGYDVFIVEANGREEWGERYRTIAEALASLGIRIEH